MAKTNWQDPQTSEIRSTHISGLMEAVGKLEESIGMETVAEANIPLTEVYISTQDRYRIFQAPAGKRNWVVSPAPIIKKNGVTITEGFTIDYAGGAIIVSPSAISTDVFTADATYITAMATSFKTHLADNAQKFNDFNDLQNYELNNKGRKAKGLLTLMSDDANVADYTTLLPISISENVPFCTAVIPASVGVTNYCNLTQLLALQDTYGWEILSHSYTHAHLTGLTDAQVEAELKNSKDWLNNNGLVCQSFAVPYGEFGTREKLLAKKYYRSMRTSLYGLTNKYVASINESPIEMHELHSIWIPEGSTVTVDIESGLSNQTLAYYQYYIDKAVANNAWLIISMHSWDIRDSNKSALLTSIIQYAKTKLEIVTFAEALNRLGNVIEVGDYSRANREKQHFAVGADGTIHSNVIDEIFAGYDKFKPSDALTAFANNKVTVTLISNAYAAANGFPVAAGGTYYTYKLSEGAEAKDYNRQEYVTFSGDKYARKHGTTDWGAWSRVGDDPIKMSAIDVYNNNTPIGNFPIGVSITKISSANNAGFPGTGVLTTYNLHQIAGELGYNWQEFNLYGQFGVYKRTVASNGTFGTWTKISAV
jgi:peptidoglycan/xylan/chitin deacetylase (PgdA/CDA1 family)